MFLCCLCTNGTKVNYVTYVSVFRQRTVATGICKRNDYYVFMPSCNGNGSGSEVTEDCEIEEKYKF